MKEKVIRHYMMLIDFLSGTLGPDYEIVLTDLNSVLAIRNGQISGRTAGAPLTDAARRIIHEKQYLDKEYVLNYQGHAENGKILRSSTFFIKENDASLSGLLCINFDDKRYKDLAENIFRLCHPDAYAAENIIVSQKRSEESERFYTDINVLIDDVLQRVAGSRLISGERLTYNEKLEIIRMLNAEGVFSVKGSIPVIADRIGVSQATMYRYISIIKKDSEERN